MDIDPRDAYIADLQAAIQRTIPVIAFAAGRVVADDPGHAGRLLAAADDLRNTVDRTAPSST
ncbi:hypothetical protein ACFYST_06005 [Kitasatospora sp. NPDC004614]|uniref:hypothetical protein n=1 Tax=unclassified Kitasatospora TaxID=2633591 RepID=UPI003674F0D3